MHDSKHGSHDGLHEGGHSGTHDHHGHGMGHAQPIGFDQPKKSEEQQENDEIAARINRIQHTIFVLSGKGGVGKSTVAVNLAVALSLKGLKVGIIDIDIHGPSVPQMLHLTNSGLQQDDDGIQPMKYNDNLKAISMGFLLQNRDEAVIWRGPLKMKVIKQFIKDVAWGDLDYLIVDSPPGTGDEPLSIVQLIPHADGALIVTTPQEVSVADVRRCVSFAQKMNVPVLGIIENMSGFICPSCGERHNIFHEGGGRRMAEDMHVQFLGAIPLEKEIVDASDSGMPYIEHFQKSKAALEFAGIVDILAAKLGTPAIVTAKEKPKASLRIAIPVSGENLNTHFGHCDQFAIYDIDESKKTVVDSMMLPPPGHQPGALPAFLGEHGVNLILTGGMGSQAQSLFKDQGILVILGVPVEKPDKLIMDYLSGNLDSGSNACDH